MPRLPRLERMFVKPQNQWSPFPKRPLPFRIPEWRKTKHKGNVVVSKARPPSQIPEITPYKEWPIIRGDLVEVMVGPDTGKQGKVRAVARPKNQIKIIGLNLAEEFLEDMGDGKSGFILNETPLHYSEVKLVDPYTGKSTDVELRFNEEGEKVRVCKQSGRVIPKPPGERTDWKSRAAVKEGEFDTKGDIIQEYTYMPSLLLFHEEIMMEMNIPMSVPKTQPERRDLIMKEIEEDVVNERMEEKKILSSEPKGIVDQLKDIGNNIMFWKK